MKAMLPCTVGSDVLGTPFLVAVCVTTKPRSIRRQPLPRDCLPRASHTAAVPGHYNVRRDSDEHLPCTRKNSMKQRGFGLLMYLLLALAILAAIASLVWWADANIETSAGVKKGEANIRQEWSDAVKEQQEKEVAQSDKAARNLEADRAKRKPIYRTITVAVDRIVARDIYRNVCLDPDGLRIARCAIRGESTDTCKPDDPLPGPPKPSGRDGGERLTLDYLLGGSLSGLSGKAPGTDGGGSVNGR